MYDQHSFEKWKKKEKTEGLEQSLVVLHKKADHFLNE